MHDLAQQLEEDRILRARIRRREAAALRMLAQASGGDPPQTPDLTSDQIVLHGPVLVAYLRVIVETWATCGGSVPQPLSAAVMDAKRAMQAATATEVSDA